jgi:hypothetical protein
MSFKSHVEVCDKLHSQSGGYIELLRKMDNAPAYELLLVYVCVTIYR